MVCFNLIANISLVTHCFYERNSLICARSDNIFSLGNTGGVVSALWRGRPPKLEIRHLGSDVCQEVIRCPIEFTPNAQSLNEYSMLISFDVEYVQNATALNIDGKTVSNYAKLI